MTDEQTEEIISSTGSLDLASGEFSRIDVHKATGEYSVSPTALLEIKLRAAVLFAGISGKGLLGSVDAKCRRRASNFGAPSMTWLARALVAALLLGLGTSALADGTRDLLHHCASHDGRWRLAARDAPPTLLLFDTEHKLVKTWLVASRNGQVASRVAAIVDAPTRRSFVVALRDVAELWEISYDPKAEDFYDGLVHDFRMGEGLPMRGFLNPRRTFISQPLENLRFDPVSTEVIGVANATVHRINLDVRRRVAGQAQADAALLASAPACP